jgi:hypothetical protein
MKRLSTSILVILAASLLWWAYRPGGPRNPHEWLNDEMQKQFSSRPGEAAASLGHWHTKDNNYIIDYEVHLSVMQVRKGTYSMLEIDLPDGRCFQTDICLRHGEVRMTSCKK